ncbi:hypothetical protein F511_32097 [Dorcoceras hygrometricum]|uniref:Uncharacterized protein n=1 Tax=Dorcoceras hygrometricum TaxID=472368 RepID=A0A2Z7ABL0_9LAMI|nr:hypothetical protein F511_32097 [Dorcoceras hygrometricum]
MRDDHVASEDSRSRGTARSGAVVQPPSAQSTRDKRPSAARRFSGQRPTGGASKRESTSASGAIICAEERHVSARRCWRLRGQRAILSAHISCDGAPPCAAALGRSSRILIAIVTPIRSTTSSETPSSGCTRSPDEISTNEYSSKNQAGTFSGEVGGGGGRRTAAA